MGQVFAKVLGVIGTQCNRTPSGSKNDIWLVPVFDGGDKWIGQTLLVQAKNGREVAANTGERNVERFARRRPCGPDIDDLRASERFL